LDSLTEPLESPVAAVLTTERSALLNDKSLEAYVTALQQTVAPAATTTLSGRVNIARAVAMTQSAAAAAQVVLSGGVSGRGVSAKSCTAALKVLEKELSVDVAATEFKVHTHDIYFAGTIYKQRDPAFPTSIAGAAITICANKLLLHLTT
jgi:hypothetical protein